MKKLLTALNAAMKKAAYVQKQGRNDFHNYRYATEADLLESIRPALVENGILLIGPSVSSAPTIDEHGNVYVGMDYTLAHVEGDVWPTPITVYGCGNDKSRTGAIGDKGLYKAYTGGNKYMLFKLLQIATGDDPERDVHPQPPEPVQPQPAPKAKSTAAEKLAITREKLMAAADDDEFRDIEAKAIGAGWATQDQTALIWHEWSKANKPDDSAEAMEAAVRAAKPANGFVETNS